jgi:DNA processing protein
VIVSGGAFGIDAVAHRSALAADGSTTIVSASGVDCPYPRANTALFERAEVAGLVVSESPPGSAPHRHRFLTRNRLIAALATGTVVTEAAARSGALNTAAHCIRLGLPLMAMPGPVTSAMSVGCHRLLRQDPAPAILVTSVEDVLAVVGSMGEGVAALDEPSRAAASADDMGSALDLLDPVARCVFDGLPARGSASEDEVALRSGVSPLEVVRAIPALRIAGVVETGPEGLRISAAFRRRPRAPARESPGGPDEFR